MLYQDSRAVSLLMDVVKYGEMMSHATTRYDITFSKYSLKSTLTFMIRCMNFFYNIVVRTYIACHCAYIYRFIVRHCAHICSKPLCLKL